MDAVLRLLIELELSLEMLDKVLAVDGVEELVLSVLAEEAELSVDSEDVVSELAVDGVLAVDVLLLGELGLVAELSELAVERVETVLVLELIEDSLL